MIRKYIEIGRKLFCDKDNKRIKIAGLIAVFTVCFFLFDLGGLLGRVFTSISNLFSNVDGEVKQVVIKGDGYDEEIGGSVQITKLADWVDSESAKLVIDVDTKMKTNNENKDVILVLDTSTRMNGENLTRIKKDTNELIELLLANNTNKIGLIVFNDEAQILNDLTNDQNSLNESIENIELGTNTNYYEALLKVEKMLESYVNDQNRELLVIFVTVGFPNVGSPNETGQYQILKEKYPELIIYGINYNPGTFTTEFLENISDIQINADNNHNPLLEPALDPEYYEIFEVVEYIDNEYFYIENTDDIVTSIGSVVIEEENGQQKLIWTTSKNEFRSGNNHTIEVKLKLNNNLIETEGLYPIITKSNIAYKLNGDSKINIESSDTPILKNGYHIVYDSNLPTGCAIDFSLDEIYYAQEEVKLTSEVLKCDGWQFKGWEVLESVDYINDDTFKMPTQDIRVKGKWSKLYLNKTMNGNVTSSTTLVYEYDYVGDVQTFTAPYTGSYQIELWGASGGDVVGTILGATDTQADINANNAGGNGAYTSGIINLTKDEKLYVYVGGEGPKAKAIDSLTIGGYNGGGNANYSAGTGGGATDIRYGGTNLNSRIMVAGAGGGAGVFSGMQTGGAAGIFNGYTGGYHTSEGKTGIYAGRGGTQIDGGAGGDMWTETIRDNVYLGASGSFGVGGAGGYEELYNHGSGAGGAGYYGGGGGSERNGSGGGGSSFISGHAGCVAITSATNSTPKSKITDGSASITYSYHYSGKVFKNTVILSGKDSMPTHDGKSTMLGNDGNGYAKITFLG